MAEILVAHHYSILRCFLWYNRQDYFALYDMANTLLNQHILYTRIRCSGI
ncbi:hypothetical protein [Klebsiella sp. BIGb0407]|nr:hypothetical protein [Klebsiella sp. BIGb0407]MCS3430856.1 hypothetical protein [Klebsiella sp. BIGb0407]